MSAAACNRDIVVESLPFITQRRYLIAPRCPPAGRVISVGIVSRSTLRGKARAAMKDAARAHPVACDGGVAAPHIPHAAQRAETLRTLPSRTPSKSRSTRRSIAANRPHHSAMGAIPHRLYLPSANAFPKNVFRGRCDAVKASNEIGPSLGDLAPFPRARRGGPQASRGSC